MRGFCTGANAVWLRLGGERLHLSTPKSPILRNNPCIDTKNNTMKLVMLFGNEVIDLIKIKKTDLTPSTLLNMQEALINRNEENLNFAFDEPHFGLQHRTARGKESHIRFV